MLNASFDREAITVKVMGVLGALGAIASLAMLFFGATIGSLVIALANAVLAFICFVEVEEEKPFFAASLGLIALAEVISLILRKGSFSDNAYIIIISIIAHFGMIAYILWNRISRFKAIWIGAVCVGDIIWRAISIPAVVMSKLGGTISNPDVKATVTVAVIYVLVGVIPTLAVTLFLFTGALDYGN